jgi:hypothetical protein
LYLQKSKYFAHGEQKLPFSTQNLSKCFPLPEYVGANPTTFGFRTTTPALLWAKALGLAPV